MKSVLLTGSSGLLGCEVLRVLHQNNLMVSTPSVFGLHVQKSASRKVPVKELDRYIDEIGSSIIRNNVDCLVHCAGISHRFTGKHLMFSSNVELTERIAQIALDQGVKRFIFLSTAKVYGEKSSSKFHEDSPLFPKTFYAQSKLMAECRLQDMFGCSPAELIILRPAPLFGRSGCKGVLGAILKLGITGRFLPLDRLWGLRSLSSAANLAEVVCTLVKRKVSMSQTIYNFAEYRAAHLSEVQAIILGSSFEGGFKPVFSTSSAASASLFGRFEVEGAELMRELDWHPARSFKEELCLANENLRKI